MNKHHYVAIMAGGIGSRFWPMSRTNFPKQFLDILGTGKTLIQQTFERIDPSKKFMRLPKYYAENITDRLNILISTIPEENYQDWEISQIQSVSSTRPILSFDHYTNLYRDYFIRKHL